MEQNNLSTEKSVGVLEMTTERLPAKPITSVELRTENLSPADQKEPKPYGWTQKWLSELIGQGMEVAHVFCGTDDAELAYTIGLHKVKVGIGSRHFVVLEMPNGPMTSAGYRVFSKKA